MVQNGRGRVGWQVGVVIIAVLAVTIHATAAEIVVVDLPNYGRLAKIADNLTEELESRGVEVVSAEDAASLETRPSAIVTDDDHATEEGQAQMLEELVREGGGLVLLVGRSRRHLEQANEFLKPWAMEIAGDPQARGPVRWIDSPLTAGLQPPVSGSLRMNISGARLVPLARQSGRVVSAGTALGEGGIIVIPAEMIHEGLQQHPPDENGLRFLVRAVSWAARLEELEPAAPAPPSRPPPQLPTPAETGLPLESTDFTEAILYDSRAPKDNWPQINAWAQDILSHTGLPLKALRVEGTDDPLAAALLSNPELVVLGTWRQFSEQEIGAVGHYVAAGGRLLVLAHAHSPRQVNLVYLNGVLSQLGVLVRLNRRGGIGEVVDSSITKAEELGQMRGGVRIYGSDIEPVAVVGEHVMAAITTYEHGQVVVLDGGPLLTDDGYRDVFHTCLDWLTQGR